MGWDRLSIHQEIRVHNGRCTCAAASGVARAPLPHFTDAKGCKEQAQKPSTRLGGSLHVCEPGWTNGEVIAAAKLFNLTDVSEGRAHDLDGVPVLLVVVVDGSDRLHTWIFGRSGVRVLLHLDVVVEDTANKRRNEGDLDIMSGGGGECQHVLLDTVTLPLRCEVMEMQTRPARAAHACTFILPPSSCTG
jgi:hypothetical protein